MQSYTKHSDKTLTLDKLGSLASTLKLPDGGSLKGKNLDKDLTVEPTKAGGVAHIVQDNLENTYEGCGFDSACSYTP